MDITDLINNLINDYIGIKIFKNLNNYDNILLSDYTSKLLEVIYSYIIIY